MVIDELSAKTLLISSEEINFQLHKNLWQTLRQLDYIELLLGSRRFVVHIYRFARFQIAVK